MSDHAKPIPLALIVCDYIHTDPLTRRRTLLGLHHVRPFQAFPTPPVPLGVYASMTEYTGKVPVSLRIVDAEEARPPVYEHSMELPGEMNPLVTVECDFNIRSISFPEPGDYRVQLLAEGVAIIERKLRIDRVMARKPPPA
jgi:hypothetical protein